MNLLGVLIVLVLAVLAVGEAYGADMGSKVMGELGLLGKVAAFLTNYALAVAAIVGSFVGAAIFVAYQKKDRFKQLLINTVFAVCTAPGLFTLTGIDATPERWLACCVVLGLSSGIILRLWVDKHAAQMAQDALLHRFARFIGGDTYAPRDRTNEP